MGSPVNPGLYYFAVLSDPVPDYAFIYCTEVEVTAEFATVVLGSSDRLYSS